MAKKAFTIMETVIAVLIASVIAISAISSNSNFSNLISRTEQNSISSEMLSIVALNGSEDFHGLTKDLQTILSEKFFIKNDKVLDYLKDIEFEYREKEPVSALAPKETSEQKWEDLKKEQSKGAQESSDIDFGFAEISAQGKEISGRILTIRKIAP